MHKNSKVTIILCIQIISRTIKTINDDCMNLYSVADLEVEKEGIQNETRARNLFDHTHKRSKPRPISVRGQVEIY